MSFLCCGVKYSKNDPETYWCIDTYLINPPFKKFVENKKIKKEIVDVLTCKKNGCLKIQIKRYDKNNKLLETQELKGKAAIKYFEETNEKREKQPLTCPMQKVFPTVRNDFKYGKVLDGTTQRIRYLNESGWADDKKIKSECKVYKNKDGEGIFEKVL